MILSHILWRQPDLVSSRCLNLPGATAVWIAKLSRQIVIIRATPLPGLFSANQ